MSAAHGPAAVAAAVGYLEGLRRGGLWSGFPTRAGFSDLWVSGFVGTHLAQVSTAGLDLTETVAALLERRDPGGGWSYGHEVPTDADSTAWCISAVAPQAPAEALEEARSVLARHRCGDGYATYRADSGIAEFVGADRDGVAGWVGAHPDVTAAVVLAGVPAGGTAGEAAVLRWLVSAASGTGLVPSYWWRGLLYGTALTLRALHARGRRGPAGWEQAMARGLARMQLGDGGYGLGAAPTGDAFTTALGLEAWCWLPHLDPGGRADRAAAALLRTQSPAGGWPGEFVLRIPAPAVVEPRLVDSWSRGTGGGNSYVPDVGGVFATATAAYALALWHRGPEPPPSEVVEVGDATPAGPDEVVVPAG